LIMRDVLFLIGMFISPSKNLWIIFLFVINQNMIYMLLNNWVYKTY
jgi:hypothetical protein